MSDIDLQTIIIRRSDEMRAGMYGTRHDVVMDWVKRAACLCLKLGWRKEYMYLKDSWAL